MAQVCVGEDYFLVSRCTKIQSQFGELATYAIEFKSLTPSAFDLKGLQPEVVQLIRKISIAFFLFIHLVF